MQISIDNPTPSIDAAILQGVSTGPFMTPPVRVLVVDDEPVIARTLEIILGRRGFRVSAFTDPLLALTVAYNDPPDFLLADVMMPNLSGIELAIRIKQLWPLCRILLISGQAGLVDLLRDARLQGYDFPLLEKPVHPLDLLAYIDDLRGVHNEIRPQ